MHDEQPIHSLLLEEGASGDETRQVLSAAGFADWCAARACLLRLGADPGVKLALANLLPHLLATLPSVASPDQVLVNLERFVRHRAPVVRGLAGQPRALEMLVTLFAGVLINNLLHL